MVCMSAKVKSNDDEARKILKGLRKTRWSKDMRLRENSPTDGVVWELKKEGETGWDKATDKQNNNPTN